MRPIHENWSFCGLKISKMKRLDCRSSLFQSWSSPVAVFFQSWDQTFKHYLAWVQILKRLLIWTSTACTSQIRFECFLFSSFLFLSFTHFIQPSIGTTTVNQVYSNAYLKANNYFYVKEAGLNPCSSVLSMVLVTNWRESMGHWHHWRVESVWEVVGRYSGCSTRCLVAAGHNKHPQWLRYVLIYIVIVLWALITNCSICMLWHWRWSHIT